MQCKRSPPTDSCSEYDPNSDSELEGDLSQCSSLVKESEEDSLSYSPIKVLALTFQGYIGRTYLATDALHCFYLLHYHYLSLHIVYVNTPCLSIFSTYSICHHTIFIHSNFVLVYQTFKRKRAIADRGGAQEKYLEKVVAPDK